MIVDIEDRFRGRGAQRIMKSDTVKNCAVKNREYSVRGWILKYIV
jgi:hypothetical protein